MLTAAERAMVSRFSVRRPTDVKEACELLGDHSRPPRRSGRVDLGEDQLSGTRAALEDHLVAVVEGFLDPAEVRDIADRVTRHWRRDPHASSLSAYGAAFFMHVGQDEASYFEHAGCANEIVEGLCPGVSDRLLSWMSRLVGEPVVRRDGWSGPGFVVIDTAEMANQQGDVHFDWEGLAVHPSAPLGSECYTALSMIQGPESGTALRIWEAGIARRSEQPRRALADGAEPRSELVEYRPGDLVVFDGLSLHQIQPVDGVRPRVMLNAHLARFPEGWRLWF